ncbi:hypothetical protein GCM10020001_104010 [Nonomuraea salmonea]
MGMRIRNVTRSALALTAAAAAVVLAAPVANAASARCEIGFRSNACTSGSLAANASGHWLDYTVEGGGFPCYSADYRVHDSDNGAIVKSGHVGSGSTSGRIPGLYGRYHIRVYNSCDDAVGTIANS